MVDDPRSATQCACLIAPQPHGPWVTTDRPPHGNPTVRTSIRFREWRLDSRGPGACPGASLAVADAVGAAAAVPAAAAAAATTIAIAALPEGPDPPLGQPTRAVCPGTVGLGRARRQLARPSARQRVWPTGRPAGS